MMMLTETFEKMAPEQQRTTTNHLAFASSSEIVAEIVAGSVDVQASSL